MRQGLFEQRMYGEQVNSYLGWPDHSGRKEEKGRKKKEEKEKKKEGKGKKKSANLVDDIFPLKKEKKNQI